ncbi:peroxidase-like [Arctopsyche grandis]|uniref:peroxidase-like n=1 Tax=Arctopsyche grandis TaxID=121162 RepID=UPI00406D93D6
MKLQFLFSILLWCTFEASAQNGEPVGIMPISATLPTANYVATPVVKPATAAPMVKPVTQAPTNVVKPNIPVPPKTPIITPMPVVKPITFATPKPVIVPVVKPVMPVPVKMPVVKPVVIQPPTMPPTQAPISMPTFTTAKPFEMDSGKGKGKGGAGACASASAGDGSCTASASSWSFAANSDEVDSKEATNIYAPKRNEKFLPPVCGFKAPPCDSNTFFRNFDGSCNNLEHPEWGVPNSTYSRILPAKYGNGFRAPRKTVDSKPLPSARKIRTSMFPTGTVENNLWTTNAMFWGQFMAHDMSLLKEPEHEFSCCTADGKYVSKRGRFCYPVKVPEDDPTMGKAGITCMNFTRTMTDKDMGCSKGKTPARQINAVTDYLDLSNVYGLSTDMASKLRSFKGGRLATEVRNNHIFAPTETNLKDNCRCSGLNENVCYKTGDSRTNQNPQLAITQILFVREHNRIADELCKLNPHWNDERLFQEARRILIAAYQRISYYEWLPIFLGGRNLIDNKITYEAPGFINDYNSSSVPSVSNEHAHAAYRFFHTHIMGQIRLAKPNRQTASTTTLAKWFNRPAILETGNNLEQFTMSMITQNLEETDNIFVEDITDKLFACGRDFGIDLRAADIQRDRDHALSYYNDYRVYCGRKEAKSFEDYGDLISAQNIAVLKTLYTNYADVDLTVGGSLEALAPGAQAGPTFLCIMNDQFLRTRKADRFWFENKSSGFTEDQLAEIRKATVSAMFCDSGDGIKEIQTIGFTLLFPGFNEVKPCSEIVRMNLTAWKETPPTTTMKPVVLPTTGPYTK